MPFVLPALAQNHNNLRRLNHVSDLDNCPLYLFVEARRVARRQDLEKPESRSASCSAGRSRRNRRAQVLSRVPGADGRANNLGPDYQALQAHRGADGCGWLGNQCNRARWVIFGIASISIAP